MQFLERLAGVIVTAIFGGFVLLTFLQVVLRYGFANSLGWIDEASRYGFIWMVAIAGAIAARRGSHMTITLLEEIAGRQWRRPLQLVGDAGLFVFAVLLGIGGWQLMQLNWTSLSPALQIPIAYVQVALPVFGILTALFAADHFVRLIRDGSDDDTPEEGF
ncbi:TRAP-type C4-dicarboxylate transport system permease small subunit [Hoeflea marina]|uniref:TRAP transporter small permease protein n=1 Tax=Hoeflea marina TaxID=274592 RepID=A0A317PV79_9HYPH|nr:TRAP transporter small permease [Hoeflea marina]PWW04595.1 TRAP-type C4-dicarboxylate transport system permease small subunit [Hoeflea marina]